MALRLALVGLVMSMGLDLPSGEELAGWSRSGREWIHSRWAEVAIGAPTVAEGSDRGATTNPTQTAAPAGSEPSDIAFEVVVEGMATTFAAELAEIRRDESEGAPAIAGIGSPPASSWRDPEPASDGPDEPPPARAARSGPGSIRDRVASAVRLTRQAAGAWAALLVASEAGDVAAP